jgi:hypothetical protein
VACPRLAWGARGRGRGGRSRAGRQDRPGPAVAPEVPAGTRQETTVVAAGPRGAVPIPAPGGAMTGSGTVLRPTGRAGPPARVPAAPAAATTVPRAVRTTEEQAPVEDSVPTRLPTRAAATGTAPVPPVPRTGAPARTLLARGPVPPATTAPAPPTAALVPPTALGWPAGATGPSAVPVARATATVTVVAAPGRTTVVARGRTGSSPGGGRPGPVGRCRADGAASPAMVPGTWRKARRRRRSGLRPAGNSRGVGPSGGLCPRKYGPSAHPGRASRPGRAPSVPATLCSGRGTCRAQPTGRRRRPPRRGSVPHEGPGGVVPRPPRPVGKSGPPANR